MMSSIRNSLSAIEAMGAKIAVSADNIANSQSEGFKKKDAVIVEGVSGDVAVAVVRDESPGPIARGPVEGVAAQKEMSNVALEEEIPQMIVAKHGYNANVKAVQDWDEMLGMIIDIVS
jgi:flagellar hook protein FlgE